MSKSDGFRAFHDGLVYEAGQSEEWKAGWNEANELMMGEGLDELIKLFPGYSQYRVLQ